MRHELGFEKVLKLNLTVRLEFFLSLLNPGNRTTEILSGTNTGLLLFSYKINRLVF
ncbi:hypothetical protein LEP1GSC096_0471 [Leptospira interrogans serovar Hebdomadis str. R499]|uniref:Uncharacterized protein n=1 Tax=Leptospira interrogans serovar Lora str. TE 1992 TaxID=1193028 RepID=M3E2I0_LEPIR|nr:hypothetical protein LEP1GSC019_2500 [Leptospira interrogans serovar Pyrogenes str. 2006006960]EKR36538.1 hypothetical protein LEP1GSC096_0471 [Leptospira interrogans serovar Hebdomadis str. R499]EMF41260.1 hypothetical protein LEP1GSC067_0921 [Leptospira interrogans serovar Lora str. TE 1992]EMF73719.1 hypothetical protein LEP1GSC148_1227 [Leptospira interrogans serovar Canicola str. LT1962]